MNGEPDMSDRLIEFVDTTTRDGNQSLWSATGLTTPDVLSIAPALDRVGYHALDFTSSTHMAVSVRFHREDPWERIRLVSEAMPATPLGMITTGMRFISWVPAAEDVMRLSYALAVRNGLRRLQIADPSNDPARLATARRDRPRRGLRGGRDRAHVLDQRRAHARVLRRARGRAGRLRRDGSPVPEGPRRPPDPGRGPRAGAALPRRPRRDGRREPRTVELHSHCTIGLAPLVYVEGVRAGFEVVHTASGPLSRGTSQPEALSTARNLEAAGFSHRLDLDAQASVTSHFEQLAARKGLPAGTPQEFDAAYYRHQLPGGMVTTTRRMLAELRRPELFDAVLDEVGRVRAEMGYPILVTPVSQLIASQATRNVIDAERWSTVSDETVRYFLGHYGASPAPVDARIADRVLARPGAAALRDLEPLSLDGARQRFGARISDEELLLRLTMPAEQVDAMVRRARTTAATAPRAPQAPGAARSPLVTLLRGLAERPSISELTVHKDGDTVVWRRAG